MLRSGSLVLAAAALAVPTQAAAQASPAAPSLDVADVALRHGAPWQVQRHPVTRVARVASGPALRLLAVPSPTGAEVDAALRDFADAQVELVGAPSAELGPARMRLHADGRRVVSYPQRVDGVRVVGAWVHFQLQGARLLTFASTAVPAPTTPAPRRLDAAAARRRAWSHLVDAGASPRKVVRAPEPVLLPGADASDPALRPAWRVSIDSARPAAREQVFVDAESGAVLRRVDARAHAGVRVVAEVDRPDGGEGTTILPVPYARGDGGDTDADGRIEVAGERFSLELAGPRAEIVDHAAEVEAAELSAEALPASGSLATAAWPRSAPPEQRTAWVFIHRAIEHGLRNAPGLAFFEEPLPVNLNVDDSDFPYCNAFYMPRNYVDDGERPATFFYAEGGGTVPGSDTTIYCYNTGRVFKVVVHEWGHGFHDHLLPAGLGLERDERSISEGVGDYVAFTLTESATIIGEITTPDSPNQYQGRTALNGLRYPEDLRTYDRGDGTLVDDVHHNGQIWSGAWWDLRALLGDLYGRSSGIRIADRLHAATLRGAPTFESAYELAIAADDDDGDPSNGTPHSCLLTAAFGRHGLAPAPRPSQGAIRYGHDAVEVAAADEPIAIAAIVDPLEGCGPLDPSSVTLSYAVDGGGFEDRPMEVVDGRYQATIPAQPDGTLVRYAIHARTTDAGSRTWSTPTDGTFHAIRVGDFEPAVLWDFEDGGDGWLHGSDDALVTDDWEIGAPTGRGLGADRAFSGRAIAGTDLGAGNGLYAANVSRTWLESPSVDCTGCERLQFRRWLRLGEGDVARVLVGGHVVWHSAGERVADDDWTLIDLDLRGLALEGPVTVRFELSSDAESVAAGWNLDDVALFTPPASDGGGCASAGGGAGSLPAALLALLALRLRRSAGGADRRLR